MAISRNSARRKSRRKGVNKVRGDSPRRERWEKKKTHDVTRSGGEEDMKGKKPRPVNKLEREETVLLGAGRKKL